jgi:hypothetical protein
MRIAAVEAAAVGMMTRMIDAESGAAVMMRMTAVVGAVAMIAMMMAMSARVGADHPARMMSGEVRTMTAKKGAREVGRAPRMMASDPPADREMTRGIRMTIGASADAGEALAMMMTRVVEMMRERGVAVGEAETMIVTIARVRGDQEMMMTEMSGAAVEIEMMTMTEAAVARGMMTREKMTAPLVGGVVGTPTKMSGDRAAGSRRMRTRTAPGSAATETRRKRR